MYSWTIFSSDSLLEMLEVLILLIAFLSSLIKSTSFLLFLIIVWYLSWINSSLMIILTIKEV